MTFKWFIVKYVIKTCNLRQMTYVLTACFRQTIQINCYNVRICIVIMTKRECVRNPLRRPFVLYQHRNIILNEVQPEIESNKIFKVMLQINKTCGEYNQYTPQPYRHPKIKLNADCVSRAM